MGGCAAQCYCGRTLVPSNESAPWCARVHVARRLIRRKVVGATLSIQVPSTDVCCVYLGSAVYYVDGEPRITTLGFTSLVWQGASRYVHARSTRVGKTRFQGQSCQPARHTQRGRADWEGGRQRGQGLWSCLRNQFGATRTASRQGQPPQWSAPLQQTIAALTGRNHVPFSLPQELLALPHTYLASLPTQHPLAIAILSNPSFLGQD